MVVINGKDSTPAVQETSKSEAARMISLTVFYFLTAMYAFLYYHGNTNRFDEEFVKQISTTRMVGGSFYLMAAASLFIYWRMDSLPNQVLKYAQQIQVLKYASLAFSSMGGFLIFVSYCLQMNRHENVTYMKSGPFFMGVFYLLTIGMGFFTLQNTNVVSVCAWASFSMSMIVTVYYDDFKDHGSEEISYLFSGLFGLFGVFAFVLSIYAKNREDHYLHQCSLYARFGFLFISILFNILSIDEERDISDPDEYGVWFSAVFQSFSMFALVTYEFNPSLNTDKL